MKVASKRLRKLSHKVQHSMGDVSHIVNETINGFAVVKSYRGQEFKRSVLKKPRKKI